LECLVASPCAWAFSFDIKSGYHHIEIFESDQQFLGFSWVLDGVTKYFKFTVLPFGLSVGPFIFSKVMRPLVKYWRSKATENCCLSRRWYFCGHKFFPNSKGILYLSGQIFSSLALLPTKISVSVFPFRSFSVGWVFLGFQNSRMFISPEKISGILREVVEIMSCCTISARNLARVTGRIISIFFYHGCKLLTKSLHRLIECRGGWDAQLVLDADVLLELKFWREHLRSLNCRPIWSNTVLPSRIVYSDVSAVGCAAFISMNGKPVSHKNWDAIEMKQSSTWREFMCVRHALRGFTHFLKR